MIQELFGGTAARLLNRDQNLPISGVIDQPTPSPSHSTTTKTTNATNTTTSDHQKLRCPRCDSSQTKFCYYNNYNLTQPRHFCKTCRRYWTKGGALRNVPIGGGCRKNKGGTTIATAIGKSISANGKLKAVVSSEIGYNKSGYMNGFELESNHNPIIWSGPSQTSHLLSLFRATQNPNPNFTSNPVTNMKDQSFMVGSHMGFDQSLGQTSNLGLCSSLWRNNHQDHQNQQQQEGLRSSSSSDHPANYYHHDHHHHHHQTAPLILGSNAANTSSASSSTILDSAPVLASGELGFWNQTLPWSDLAAANGAYP